MSNDIDDDKLLSSSESAKSEDGGEGGNNRYQNLIDEYKEASHYHRLHITLLFGQLTVYLGVSGALINFVTKDSGPEGLMLTLIGVFGCIISFVFLIQHERVYASSYSARSRAEYIQHLLDLELYKPNISQFDIQKLLPLGENTSNRINSIVNKTEAASANRLLYISGFIYWIFACLYGFISALV
ncbi:MAG: hypothetical protein GY789_06180 [Hyphomicrobiales bacterium]|nr:hypothetical protein [Hyphomicrobiales bacterium]